MSKPIIPMAFLTKERVAIALLSCQSPVLGSLLLYPGCAARATSRRGVIVPRLSELRDPYELLP
jgi:hypothetical protein